MFTPEQIESKLDRILLRVEKPGRYVGGELNSTLKDWDSAKTRVAFVFPDVYDIGISNVGLKILYDQVNQREDALAERAYSPWFDMEALMREHGIPLYALESKRPLAGFDLIGFSLPYETLYTNALNILDLANIPVRSLERDDNHPIVIAGGHSTNNPEPMHAFIDAFVIGEGEEVVHDIINSLQKTEGKPREERLREFLNIPSVYVPVFMKRPTWKTIPLPPSNQPSQKRQRSSTNGSLQNCRHRPPSSLCRTSAWSITASRLRSCVDAPVAVDSARQV